MPEHSRMVNLLMRFPERGAVLMSMAEQFLRGESELTEAEREIIFAYGSAINDCQFCHVSHKYTAAELGVDESVWDAVLADLDRAPIDDRMRAMLRYVDKLNRSPSAMTASDAAAVLEAGWSEEALFDAVCVCGFNNLMNRVVDAVGIVGTDDEHRESGRRLASLGYDGTMAKARERLSAAPDSV
jgi:uncharacterized peroxidase-related enzyme